MFLLFSPPLYFAKTLGINKVLDYINIIRVDTVEDFVEKNIQFAILSNEVCVP